MAARSSRAAASQDVAGAPPHRSILSRGLVHPGPERNRGEQPQES